MVWIVSADVIGNDEEKKARLQFVEDVTGDKSILWEKFVLRGIEFYYCRTNDGVKGVFITAHNNAVRLLCTFLPGIELNDFVVANTCVWENDFDKKILQILLKKNHTTRLYYAKQETKFTDVIRIRQIVAIDYVGLFGFMTSKSERILYRNREKGLMKAVQRAFDLVNLDELRGVKNERNKETF